MRFLNLRKLVREAGALLGIYLKWWIVILGAQVAYACQNRVSHLEQRQVKNIDQRSREIID